MFSRRTHWPSEKNPLISCLEELKTRQKKIFDLTESNPTQAGFSYPVRSILKPLTIRKSLSYEPQPFGLWEARKAVCAMYAKDGIMLDPAQIILTASSSEAYSFLFRLLLNVDDEILFPQPSYPLFDFLAQINDVQMYFYPLEYENHWKIGEQGFLQAVTKKTKVVTLVSPNNPTGCFVKENELKFINEACQRNDLAIICDEVFFDYIFDENKAAARSLAAGQDVLTFTLGGLSKSLGLPQMKLSWIVVTGPKEKTQEALERLEIIADTYLSVNTPVQNALPHWLMLKNKIQKPIKERIEKNKKTLGAFCQKAPFNFLHADGGWYGILRLPQGTDEEAFVLNLLREHGVFVHPGYFFDMHEGAHIIVSFLTPEDIFREGLKRILSA